MELPSRDKTIMWSQWADLNLPQGITHAATNGLAPNANDLESIEFFVPKYMGGPAAISMIGQMKSLRVIQSPNAGVDDVLAILPKGVTLCNAAGVHDASTAELAVALSIASRRGFADFARNQVAGKWMHERKASLTDSNIAIVGFGNIGKMIAAMLAPFDVRVTSFSNSGRDGSQTMDKFDFLLPTFDVIILIVPLNAGTRHLMNATRLGAMKDGAALVNVARGPVVDTDALIKELESGRITAALDVTDPEPLPDGHRLWSSPNVIITPHVGGDSQAFIPRGRKLVEEQAARYAAGEPLLHVVAQ
jgi:phosphoglycerate dehydrogenase-like enzyme